MTDVQIHTEAELDDAVRAELEGVLSQAVSLPDLIRAGSAHTVKHEGWGAGDRACALSAAAIAARSVGII